jgi:PKHD-type hydroxylase
MILPIGQLLSAQLLEMCQLLGQRDELFTDGKNTAGWHARELKHNLQARPEAEVKNLLNKVSAELMAHELMRVAARPKSIVRLMISRYKPGMYYGEHVDDAIMDAERTDLSFTLFLTPAQDYEGGELIINEPAAERAFKLDAGSLLLYPSTSLHSVAQVTQGERLVIVGWIRSLIRDPAQRELLFDLERAITQLRSGPKSADDNMTETLSLLLKTRSNLLRLWAD